MSRTKTILLSNLESIEVGRHHSSQMGVDYQITDADVQAIEMSKPRNPDPTLEFIEHPVPTEPWVLLRVA